MNKVIKLLKSHRSIRKFLNKKIEEEKIKVIIESAQSASTSSYLQLYTIIGIEDKSILKEISKIKNMEIQNQPESAQTENQDYIVSCALFLVFCADLYRLKFISDLKNYKIKIGNLDSLISSTLDVAIAAQNAMITAESLGLGGVYVGSIRNNPQKICELLHIPQYVFPVLGMSLGYPDQEIEKKPRLPINVIFKNEKYDITGDIGKIELYDSVVKKYYSNRVGNKKSISWSEQIDRKLSKERRPHLKKFLVSKGFYF